MKHVRITVAFLRGCAILGSALVLAACATRSSAPVEERRAVPPPIARVPAPAVPPLQPAPQPTTAPVVEPELPPTYTVKRGDTLAGIALEHGLDYRELAAWNGVENPNRILVGQMLRLAPPGEPAAMAGVADPSTGVVTAPLRAAPPIVESRVPPAAPSSAPVAAAGPRNTESLKVAPKAVREPYSEERAREMARALEPPQVARVEPPRPATPSAAAPSPAPSAASPATASVTPSPAPSTAPSSPSPPAATASSAPASGPAPASALADDEDLDWIWPARGKLVTGFSDTANLKGIDIAGAIGQPIVASAAGRVVYAGSGLRGYGKLVIIKHNAKFLTAYAHNREIVVKEGQQVARGQKIAEMGNTDADQVKLHFEIRRLGKPMDPLRYLPPAS